jgi:hypothetical protein
MSKSATFDLLLGEMGRLSAAIGEQEKKLSAGTPQEKVHAAGELAELRQRADSLRDRLHRLRDAEASATEDLRTELEVELRHLAEAFERWLDNR